MWALPVLGPRPKTPSPRYAARLPRLANSSVSAKCGECHKTAFGIWEQDEARPGDAIAGDGHAAPALTIRNVSAAMRPAGTRRSSNPFATGFLGLTETPQLAGKRLRELPRARRWTCRGGSRARTWVQRDQSRQAMRLTKATVELTCASNVTMATTIRSSPATSTITGRRSSTRE